MILSTLLFIAGLHFMIMILAAGYRIVDLWYRIEDFWVGILLRITVLVFIDGLLINVLSGDALTAFVWGQASYLIFHITVFWFTRLGIYLAQTLGR